MTEPPDSPDREAPAPAPRPNALLERHPVLCGYAFLATVFVLVFTTPLRTFFLSFLFLYLVSDFFTRDVRRLVPFVPKAVLFSVLYALVIGLVVVLSTVATPKLVRAVPALTAELQPRMVREFRNLEDTLHLSDYVDPERVVGSLLSGTSDAVRFVAHEVSRFYKGALFVVFALVINGVLYHDPTKLEAVFLRRPESLLGFLYAFSVARLRVFYYYFKRVMLGQIAIAAINAAISSVVVVALRLPHPVVLIGTIFFCSLFPIVGNLVSNSILTITALVASGVPAALVCLALLAGIHKLEYFLNSRIIGGIVRVPMVVTLATLIVSEVLLGLIGLILAIPLLLFLRAELESIRGLPAGEVPQPWRTGE